MSVTKTIFILSLLFVIVSSSNPNSALKEKCYVLALEGGGDKGAYQAGALKGLVDNVPNGETQWDVVTGVSVGSMDAAAIAIHEIGKEKDAVDLLLNTWRGIEGKHDIYQNWWGGPLWGLFYKTSLYDTSPMMNLLQKIVKDFDMQRKFVCGATNYLTGEFETWDEETLYRSEYEYAISSSGSYPVVFPLTEFRGNYYMDGGVKVNLDIFSGINKCHDMGYSQEQIILDVVLLNNSKTISPKEDIKNVHPLSVLMRVFEIYGYDNSMRDFDYAVKAYPKVNFRYVVAPTKHLPSGSIPLTFSPSQIEEMIQFGVEDAKNVIKMGEGKSLENLLSMFHKENDKKKDRRSKKPSREAKTTTPKENVEFLE